ncbi:MAG: carboxypeptidase regulatory-like domain-containing protein, partial [Gemmatimonadota bacterium]
VTLTVTVTDSNGDAVEGARVRIENASTGALISNGTTNASGVYTDATYNYGGDLSVRTKIRLKGYKPFRTLGTIVSTGISVGATLITDTIVDLP